MIPKIIHYCWFGKNPKPALVQKCITSWEKHCPEYEIIEWNEDNFDITINRYVFEAYEAEKWAFVSDYARLWIIYNKGGIYLDTDVELLRPLDDLLELSAFLGFEDNKSINTGLGFGAEKENILIGRMLCDYEKIHFIKEDGTLDKLPCPIRNTASISEFMPREIIPNSVIELEYGNIYPPEYFAPLSADGSTIQKTKNTYSIHWYSAMWLSDDEMIVHKWRLFRNKCEKIFGKTLGGYVARVIYLFFPEKRKVLKRM